MYNPAKAIDARDGPEHDVRGAQTGPQQAMRNAFVTLVTNADYIMGATALVHSLHRTGTTADIVILHTGAVSPEALGNLKTIGCRTIEVSHLPLSDGFNERHARKNLHGAAPFTKGRKPEFHTPLDNFCKLRLWELTEYGTLVFLDADVIVLKNIDKLFEYPEFSAAPNVYESLADFHRLNSGVFVAKPSLETFERMLIALDRPDAFWRRTDQTFLESFFPDWHGLPVTMNMLQYVWFNMPALWDWKSVAILHYQYEKPWETDHPKAEVLRPLIDLWQAFHDGRNIPDTSTLPGPQSSDPGDLA